MDEKRIEEGWRLTFGMIRVSAAQTLDCHPQCPFYRDGMVGRRKLRLCSQDPRNAPVELMAPRKRKGEVGDENALQAARRTAFCLMHEKNMGTIIRRFRFEQDMARIGM